MRKALSLALTLTLLPALAEAQAPPTPTKRFEIRNERAYLDGQEIKLWGIRGANALHSPAVTERFVRNLDNMAAHGINAFATYIMGSNTGWPEEWAARNGFEPDGRSVAHTIDEYVPVDGLVACAQGLAVAAMRFCGVG